MAKISQADKTEKFYCRYCDSRVRPVKIVGGLGASGMRMVCDGCGKSARKMSGIVKPKVMV